MHARLQACLLRTHVRRSVNKAAGHAGEVATVDSEDVFLLPPVAFGKEEHALQVRVPASPVHLALGSWRFQTRISRGLAPGRSSACARTRCYVAIKCRVSCCTCLLYKGQNPLFFTLVVSGQRASYDRYHSGKSACHWHLAYSGDRWCTVCPCM